MDLTRRKFLKGSLTAGVLTAITGKAYGLKSLQPAVDVDNPLENYPDRDWEKIYHDQYRYDSSFTFVCSPNDTHHCRVKAFVRNGVAVRVEQNYDHQRYSDLYGNKATPNWNPRMCLKGYTFPRRVYGPYRLKSPIIRKGWKQWADDGFPELTPANKSKYMFDARGQDEFVRASWEEVNDYIAKGFIHIAQTYSGEEGAKRLLDEGYPPEMIEPMKDTQGGIAGTRTFKLRGGMGLLGVIGKYGMYRLSNSLALLDTHLRKVDHEHALGGRTWSNYTWHGDQAPGHPYVHGLQASEIDLNDLRFSKIHIQVGKNMVENKMPESHWFIETMERGAKIVVISPEYNPPATKADYWIPVRPGISDTSIFLGISKYLMDNNLYDEPFVKKFTDFPLLVRTDNLKRLRAHEVFKGYKSVIDPNGASFKIKGLKKEQYEKLGDFVVFDAKTKKLKAITRDEIGDKMTAKGINPDMGYKGTIKLANGEKV